MLQFHGKIAIFSGKKVTVKCAKYHTVYSRLESSHFKKKLREINVFVNYIEGCFYETFRLTKNFNVGTFWKRTIITSLIKRRFDGKNSDCRFFFTLSHCGNYGNLLSKTLLAELS